MLRQLSGKDSLPRNAIGVTSAIAGVLLLLALSDDAYATLISMATVGFYIAFAFPVFTALRARLAGDWTTGRWNIGSWDLPVNVIAALWLAFEIVNIAWPRLPDAPWYVNWGAVLMVVIVALLGVVVRGGMRMQEMPEPAVAEAA
jgi:amino acid transporter